MIFKLFFLYNPTAFLVSVVSFFEGNYYFFFENNFFIFVLGSELGMKSNSNVSSSE